MISRQRRWQLKQRELNKCIICAEPAVTKEHCEKHRQAHLRYHYQHAKKPKHKAQRKIYFLKHYAKKNYGKFAEHFILISQIQNEIRRKIYGDL